MYSCHVFPKQNSFHYTPKICGNIDIVWDEIRYKYLLYRKKEVSPSQKQGIYLSGGFLYLVESAFVLSY